MRSGERWPPWQDGSGKVVRQRRVFSIQKDLSGRALRCQREGNWWYPSQGVERAVRADLLRFDRFAVFV